MYIYNFVYLAYEVQSSHHTVTSISVHSAHMYYESPWSEALSHSSAYSIFFSFFAIEPDNTFASPVKAISSHSFHP